MLQVTDRDVVAPAIAPDGKGVAFEVPGEGIPICPIAGSGPCTSLQVGDGHGVRPAWRSGAGELLLVRYKVEEGLEDSDIFIAARGLDEPRPLAVQTGRLSSYGAAARNTSAPTTARPRTDLPWADLMMTIRYRWGYCCGYRLGAGTVANNYQSG